MENLIELFQQRLDNYSKNHNAVVVEARETLRRLQKSSFPACVAGGWGRDILLGVAPKDIDVFVSPLYLSLETEEVVKLQVTAKDMQEVFQEKSEVVVLDADYLTESNIRSDVEALIKFELVDIICMKTSLQETISNFDCSVCQCCVILTEAGDLEFTVSEDFLEFLKSGVIYTYSHTPVREDHKLRLSMKYPSAIWKEKDAPSENYFGVGVIRAEDIHGVVTCQK